MNRRQRRASGRTVSRRASMERAARGEMPARFGFPCPFCDGMCTAEVNLNAVGHSVPTCTTFMETEVSAFMRKVNDTIAERTGAIIDRTNPNEPVRKRS